MKDLSYVRISNSSSAAERYNELRQKSHTTFFEARRTMEALSCVQNHKHLLEKVKEETAYDTGRDQSANTRSDSK